MIKLLILAVFAYLISRTISRVFDSIQSLFKATSTKPNTNQSPQNDSLSNKDVKNNQRQHISQIVHQVQKNHVQKESNQLKKHHDHPEIYQSPSLLELMGPVSRNQPSQPQRSPQQIAVEPIQHQVHNNQLQIHNNPQLNLQSLKLQAPQNGQKKNLTERNNRPQQPVAVQSPRQKSDDLSSVKKQQSSRYFSRFNKNEYSLLQSVNRRHSSSYHQQIQSLHRQVKDKQSQIQQLRKLLSSQQEQKKTYIEKIEEIIEEVRSSKQQKINQELQPNQDKEMFLINQLKKSINHSHQTITQREKVTEQYEHYIANLQILLANKQNQNQRLKQSLTAIKQQTQHTVLQLKTKIDHLTNLNSAERIKSSIVQSNSQLQIDQQLIFAKQNLQQVQQKYENCETQLFQVRSKLIQVQSQKKQLENSLEITIQQLKRQKLDIQNKLNQQLQKQFREEQSRQTQQSERQAAIFLKHQSQIAQLTEKLQKEQLNSKSILTRLEQTKEELQFCQIQLTLASETQKQLRDQITNLKANQNQPQQFRIDLSESEVQSHPLFLRMKQKYEQAQAQLKNNSINNPQQKNMQSSINFGETSAFVKLTNSQNRKEVQSSSFTYIAASREPTTPTESKYKVISRVGSTFSSSSNNIKQRNSAINMGAFDKEALQRYKTPIEKPLLSGSLLENSIYTTFFGQTNILDQRKRQFTIAQINRLKRIGSKRTKLLYRSQSKNSKPISDFTSNVPNIFIVVELPNKKIIGAFSQTAFTKQGNLLSEKSKYLAMNKSMIIDITEEKVFPNQITQETIKYDSDSLIWGKNELVLSWGEPLMLTCNLNCENAVYPCQYSTEQLMGDKESTVAVSQCQVFRIFLG